MFWAFPVVQVFHTATQSFFGTKKTLSPEGSTAKSRKYYYFPLKNKGTQSLNIRNFILMKVLLEIKSSYLSRKLDLLLRK